MNTEAPTTEQAPKLPPENVALRARARPVTRLNRRMLALLIGGLAAAVLGGTLWSLQSGHRKGSLQPAELYNVDRVARSDGLDQLPSDYSKMPPALPAPTPDVPQLGRPLPGDLGGPILKAEQQAQRYGSPGNDPAEAERLARLKEAEEAAGSSVFFRSGRSSTQGKATAQAATPPALGAGMTNPALNPMGAGLASAPQAGGVTADANRQDQKEAFLAKGGPTKTRSSSALQLPASPYQVMAGTIIAAALVTGIQSDLPGDVIATVTEPVYDTATGRYVLIPQGSRLMGKYNSQVSYGQSRVQVVWNRVILPDTSSVQLDKLVGADAAGRAGLEDGVDWHWNRILAGAALTTLLGVGAELAAPENRQDGDRIVIAGRDGLQDTLNQVGQEMTRRNMNIQPTLTSQPGLPVRVIVNTDIALRPYQPLFYQLGGAR